MRVVAGAGIHGQGDARHALQAPVDLRADGDGPVHDVVAVVAGEEARQAATES